MITNLRGKEYPFIGNAEKNAIIKKITRYYNLYKYIISLAKKEDNIEIKCLLFKLGAYFAACNVCSIYADYDLEQGLIRIADKIETKIEATYEKDTCLHVFTDAYSVGGHTRLIENFTSDSNTHKKHSIAITSGKKAFDFEGNDKKFQNCHLLEGGEIAKALELRRISSRYDKIILYTHMYDIVPLIAYGSSDFTRPVFYYNHADHRFWVGASISDLVFEMSTTGRMFSRLMRGIEHHHILPIPVDVDGSAFKSKQYCRDRLKLPHDRHIVLSIGGASKYGKMFINTCMNALKLRSDICFLIVGPDKNQKMWQDAYEKSHGRINAIGIVPHAEISAYYQAADMYLDSMPVGGGTVMVEALLHQLPALTWDNGFTQFDAYINCRVGIENLPHEISKILSKANTDDKNALCDRVFAMHSSRRINKKFNELLDKYDNHEIRNFSPLKKTLEIDMYDINLSKNMFHKFFLNREIFSKIPLKYQIRILIYLLVKIKYMPQILPTLNQ